MKITGIELRRYDIPLVRPLVVGGRESTSRKGIIVSLTDDAGHTVHGEAAPLPGLHAESLEEVVSELKAFRRRAGQCGAAEIMAASQTMSWSSKTALEMAMFDLRSGDVEMDAMRRDVRIPVSGLVMAADEGMYDEVEAMLEAGYVSVKVKVGRRSVGEDIRAVERLRTMIAGRAGIRLDANRAWSLNDAAAFCKAVGAEGIEYIEEPLADVEEYEAFYERTDMPVAFDETLAELGIDGVEEWEGAAVYVLKPSLLGGLTWTGEFIARALEADVRPVMSCAFESDLSLRAFARFAVLFRMFDTPLGLDTLKWFETPLLREGFEVSGGHVDAGELMGGPAVLRTELLEEV